MGVKSEQPRVYVACLAAYNSGQIHGSWIDAAQDAWAIYDAVQMMLRASPVDEAEEWAIHDYEGFGGARVEEYDSFDHVSALAAFIVEYGALGAALLDYYGGGLEEAREALAERYVGEHASLAGYVQELTEETTAIPSALRFYIDWEAMARDAEINGDLLAFTTGWNSTHVFTGR